MRDILRFEQAAFKFPQDGCGVPPVSLSIRRGESLYLAGSSGSGKSTLARMACGIIPHLYHGKFDGRVLLGGKLTSDMPIWQISDLAGMVFQNPASQMLTTTVEDEIIFGLENLGLQQSKIKDRLDDVLDRFGLDAFRLRAPSTLSGGEQQKLALACALARKAPLLVLDEPLSMLDSTSAHNLVQYLGSLKNDDQSLLLFEHRDAFLNEFQDLIQLNLESDKPQLPLNDLHAEDFDQQFLAAPQINIEARNLEVHRGNRTILSNVHFNISGGKVVVLLGRNGSGKTTLLRSLAGLQNFSGSLCVNDKPIKGQSGFAMVFQNPDVQIFQASVREEILFNLKNPDMAWYAWLIRVLELERYEHKPPLLLSEGEKRRVVLATALMSRPSFGILLDEPSLGQDKHHKAILKRLITKLSKAGYLVFIATHDLELAAHADILMLLNQEGLFAQDLPERVFQNPGLWKQAGLWLPNWFDTTSVKHVI